jgi:multidrug resistance efflux pump
MPETPPDRVLSPPGLLLTQGLLYLVLAGIIVLGLWASFARLDIVVKAEGRLSPKGGPIRLSATTDGVIADVLVAVGDHVVAGQPLLRIDSFRQGAEEARTQHTLDRARTEIQRYRETAHRLQASLAGLREELSRAERALVLRAEEEVAVRRLADDGLVARLEAAAREREVAEAQGRVARLRSDLLRSEEEVSRNERLAEEAEAQAFANAESHTESAEAMRRMVVTAPSAGTVTFLASERPGRHVRAEDVAAAVLRDGEPLYAEIRIPNPSMRRVHAGLPARLKFKAYPYQDFGILRGVLEEVEPDADESGAYRAWVRLEAFTLRGPRGPEPLRPGLLLSSEIVVDRRTVVEVLLDPYRRLRAGLTVSE